MRSAMIRSAWRLRSSGSIWRYASTSWSKDSSADFVSLVSVIVLLQWLANRAHIVGDIAESSVRLKDPFDDRCRVFGLHRSVEQPVADAPHVDGERPRIDRLKLA